jgi:molybdenum cofactor cytidylyltransferase
VPRRESSNAEGGTVAAVVLAAGLSSRMGRFKPLLPFGGRPMVARVVESLAESGGVGPVLVVTGHRSGEVEGAVGRQPVRFVFNGDYAVGEMLSSVQAGVRALPKGAAAFVLALGDQPAVRPATIRLLVEAWAGSRAPVVVPTYAGRTGHPVVIASACGPEILALGGPGQTLKSLMHRRASQTVEVPTDDPAVLADVDTPQDYQEALRLWEHRSRAQSLAEMETKG